jgi:hypothetical protein
VVIYLFFKYLGKQPLLLFFLLAINWRRTFIQHFSRTLLKKGINIVQK